MPNEEEMKKQIAKEMKDDGTMDLLNKLYPIKKLQELREAGEVDEV